MGGTTTGSKAKRRDHYLPQSYLRGFIDPNRLGLQQPLWHLNVADGVWSEKSPREVAYRLGFYDFSTSAVDVEAADVVFGELERNFPVVRREVSHKRFRYWRDHLGFLLRYAQMMRARSLLFFEHMHAEDKHLRKLVIEAISPDGRTVKVRSMTPEPIGDAFIRNRAVAEMCAEIRKGAAWLNDFNWALRYCESSADPFVVSEVPFIVQGRKADLADALRDPDTLLFFPLCWQSCLIGSRRHFAVETDLFGQVDMRSFRRMYRESARIFLLSPARLDDL